MRRGIIGVLSFWAGMGIVFTLALAAPFVFIGLTAATVVGAISLVIYKITNSNL